MLATLTSRQEDGAALDVLVWRPRRALLAASTAFSGGGLGPRRWVINAEVPHDYHRLDIDEHVAELSAALGLPGSGIGMLTAAQIHEYQQCSESGVDVAVTVGLSHPTWAASDDDALAGRESPGTINIVAFFPVRLDDGAMLNAIATATEAKSQALWESALAATGTPSDAVSVLCPLEGDAERFGGPRSIWGARLARAVHRAVLTGASHRTS
jgi:adenosylcobinamide amidohydrolase